MRKIFKSSDKVSPQVSSCQTDAESSLDSRVLASSGNLSLRSSLSRCQLSPAPHMGRGFPPPESPSVPAPAVVLTVRRTCNIGGRPPATPSPRSRSSGRPGHLNIKCLVLAAAQGERWGRREGRHTYRLVVSSSGDLAPCHQCWVMCQCATPSL